MMTRYAAALIILAIATPASAQEASKETLNLFPKGREAYSAKFDEAAERYEVDGRNYVDNLYEYKGEGAKAEASPAQKPKVPEAELDAYIEGTASLNESVANPPTDAPPLPDAQ